MIFSRTFVQRARVAAFWAAPPLLALALYWPGLTAWFQKDDFVWLGLRDMVVGWRSLWWALFAPLAQGTIRTLSERIFFLSFYSAFGLHPLPYRCWAFLTHAATLTLLSSVCAKLTGSRAAGFWAAILWTVNGALAIALSWTAIYYELLCSFFLLLSFWLLLRYVETGQRRYYLAQCVTFVLGFGVLELNVVYPALATVFALCRAPRILGKVLPLFVISAAYTVAHMAAAPLQTSGPYKMYWDSSVISTFWTYWKWALGPTRLILVNIHPSVFRSALTVLLTIGMIGFLAWKLRRRQWVVLFFPAWFLIVLAPVLPLRDHVSDYYLTVPLIGLAMWGGWGLVSGWHAGPAGRIAVLSLLAIYMGVSVPVAHKATLHLHDRSQEIRKLVLGVASLSQNQPEKLVLLTGVSTEMFWSAIYNRAFRLFDIDGVYLVAENERSIAAHPELGEVRTFFINPTLARKALKENRAVVYDVGSGFVRDITAEYRPPAAPENTGEVAARVDVGDARAAAQVGPAWYSNEGGFRWMPARATVWLRGPRTPQEKLYVTGFCPAAALRAGPLKMQISMDGERLPPVWVRTPESEFSFEFNLPPQTAGLPVVEVAIELDRTFRTPSDQRELGLAFGSFEIR